MPHVALRIVEVVRPQHPPEPFLGAANAQHAASDSTPVVAHTVAFDLLRVDGHNLTCNPWSQRRALLEGVWVDRQCARLADVFNEGHLLFDAVVSNGLEGIVAKRRAGLYRSGYRGWTKVKNPSYWRRESEVELMQRRRERVGAQTR